MAILWLMLIMLYSHVLNQLLNQRYNAMIGRPWVICSPLSLGAEQAPYFMVLLITSDGERNNFPKKTTGEQEQLLGTNKLSLPQFTTESELQSNIQKRQPDDQGHFFFSVNFFFLCMCLFKKLFLGRAQLLVCQVTLNHLFNHLLRGKMLSFNSIVYRTVYP